MCGKLVNIIRWLYIFIFMDSFCFILSHCVLIYSIMYTKYNEVAPIRGNISGADIKSDPSILNSMLLERLGDKGYLQKFQTMVEAEGKVFFLTYMNNIGSKIDGSDLICVSCMCIKTSCAPARYFPPI
jgi:hypothetical protein